MVLALMQPYFFPHLGYFDLVDRADHWVVFDTAQYIRRGWVNRNRILGPAGGWQYIVVPVRKHRRDTAICDIQIVDGHNWVARIERQLQHYRGHAPHFEAVMDLVRECLRPGESSLARLNVSILARVCAFLGIRFEGRFLSEMGLALQPIERPGDWALRLAEALGADEYVNPPGGRDLYSADRFAASGVRLTIQSPVAFTYECPGYRFEPSLSIVDVLMWNSADAVRQLLAERRRSAASALSAWPS